MPQKQTAQHFGCGLTAALGSFASSAVHLYVHKSVSNLVLTAAAPDEKDGRQANGESRWGVGNEKATRKRPNWNVIPPAKATPLSMDNAGPP